jgi:hypothetical protein
MSGSAIWTVSHRADPFGCELADRHYNRQKIGSPQFVPPGRCFVLRADDALWVTSWPYAQYTKHAWAGAWMNSLFRREDGPQASEMIREAISHTRHEYGDAPELGMVTFVDPAKVRPVMRRGRPIYGYCYLKAGFTHVGYTKRGLWAWQMLPHEMPPAAPAHGQQSRLAA